MQIYVFYLDGDYASGVIVVIAETLEAAQEIGFKEGAPGDSFNIKQPSDLNNYEIMPIKGGLVTSHSYAE